MLAGVDELWTIRVCPTQSWAALGERMDKRQLMDFVFTVGGYHMLAMALNTFGVEPDQRRSRSMAFFPKPAAGSWTENWPELGTAPVNYTDSIDPEHYLLEQQAIFKKTWLKVGRVEQLPRRAVTSPARCRRSGPGTSVIIVKDKRGRRPALLQHVPPPRQQAGVERLSRRRGLRRRAASSPASTTPGATASTVI